MAVLITRPDERGKQLVELLNQLGVVALHMPLFTIEAGHELAELPGQLNRLNAGDYVFPVSKSAVDFADNSLKNTGFAWREDLDYFTVGQRTAQYFSTLSGRNIRYPIRSENSEGLLELPAMRDLQGKQILILRGNGGRDFFREQAQLRGATVHYVECYRRAPIAYNAEEQTDLCKRAGVQTIVATSLDIVQSLLDFVPEQEQPWLKNCTLVTVSQRIADFARRAGWQHVVISPKADNPHLLNTLLNLNHDNPTY